MIAWARLVVAAFVRYATLGRHPERWADPANNPKNPIK